MANLKDIGYGVGKYLEASDASGIPDIGTNRTNIDLLNFKVATNNAYALYNFKDGMIDAYQTSGGVDAGTSTNETYDSINKLYSPNLSSVTAFTSTGAATWTAPTTANVEVLIVAGGGGGPNQYYAGGGGGGGVVHAAAYPVTASTVYDLTVGAGGAVSVVGSNSVFNVNGEGANTTVLTANGGGRGGGSGGSANGGAGGSGGGNDNDATGSPGASNQPTSFGTPQIATGYGNAGGDDTGGEAGGGGGGANGVGDPAGPSYEGGTGGAGKLFSSFVAYGTTSGNVASSGSDGGYFGGGGGGGAWTGSSSVLGGPGGVGGGGKGGGYGSGRGSVAGTVNTGGGGGGAGGDHSGGDGTGKAGGSGIVLIKETASGMTLVSNTQTAQAAPTEGRLMLYEEDVDSITLDTDLKGYVSRDGGTTYTQVTLAEDTIYAPAIAFNQGGNDSYTKLLLHCDGSNNGTTWTDSSSSGHTVTMSSGSYPRTETGTKKFGTASGKWNNASYLQVPDSADWHFGSGDYTVDFWLYHPQHCSTDHFDFIIAQPNAGGGNQSYIGTRRAGSGNYYMMTNFSGQSTQSNADITVTLNEWNHWAIVKNSGSVYFYKDGVNVMGTGVGVSAPVAWPDYNVPLRIGYQQDVEYYNGYADEIRISKGIARWTTDFVPATRLSEAYNAGSYTEAEGSIRLVSGSVDISGQPSGTNMKYKIETLNSKNLKLHGASLLWA